MLTAPRALLYRLAGWPRRMLALACLLLAGLSAMASPSGGSSGSSGSSGSALVIAARPLAAGTVLSAADLSVATWPDRLRPTGSLSTVTAAVGRRLAGPMQPREAVTTSRLVGNSLTAGLASDLLATTVTLAGTGAQSLVQAGDSVDLFAASDDSAARAVAQRIRVLAVLAPDADSDSVSIVVAADRSTALALAAATHASILAMVHGSP
jgi:pilus assembly protein CpaB